jgi:hypothetical protein
MKLVRIAKGRWEVLAEVDSQGRCQVLDLLERPGEGLRAARDFLNLFLRVYLPLEGPPGGCVRPCKPLGDGIFELCRRPGEPALRVSLFDDGERIVCTNAFAKSKNGNQAEVRSARSSRERYFEARSARGLQISETP